MADYDLNLDVISLKLKSAAEKLTYKYLAVIKEEIPEKSGKAKSETRITKLAENNQNSYVSEISIGPSYMWKVWKGSSSGDNLHFAKNFPFMVFSDWPNGPDVLRWSDGKFRFKVVNHHVDPNNFIERATQNLQNDITTIFGLIFQ